jgi:hypothetical protein
MAADANGQTRCLAPLVSMLVPEKLKCPILWVQARERSRIQHPVVSLFALVDGPESWAEKHGKGGGEASACI